MRTDAKIGFAIAGVLMAVLCVYGIVVTRHSKKAPTNVQLVQTPPDSSESVPVTPLTPPITAASDNAPPVAPAAQPVKDVLPPTVAIGPVSTGPPSGSFVAMGPTADSAFHSTTPKEQDKSDDVTSVKMNEGGVYTPDSETHPKIASIKHTSSDDRGTVLGDSSLPAIAGDHLYTVKPGQTLSSIASEVYGNSRFWVAIQRENKGLDAKRLKVGMKINLPDGAMVHPGPVAVDDVVLVPTPAAARLTHIAPSGSGTYTVQAGDNLYRISKKLFGSGRKADTLYALNKDRIGADKSKLKLGTVLALPRDLVAASN